MPFYHALPDYPLKHILTRHETGRGPGRRLRQGHGRGRGVRGHERTGGDQPGNGAGHGPDGLRAARGDYGPGRPAGDGQRLLPGDERHGHDAALTKHSFLVEDPDELYPAMRRAFEIARSGRPGPVLWTSPKTCSSRPRAITDTGVCGGAASCGVARAGAGSDAFAEREAAPDPGRTRRHTW